MVDTRVGEQVSVSDVSVVREFVDVFLEESLGVPPERKVEFRTNLVPATALISKAPYCLAPASGAVRLVAHQTKQFAMGSVDIVRQEECWITPNVH